MKKKKNLEKIVQQRYKDAQKELNKTKMNDKEVCNMKDLSKNIIRRKQIQMRRKQYRNNDEASIEAEEMTSSAGEHPTREFEFNKDDPSTTSSITDISLCSMKDNNHHDDYNHLQDNGSIHSMTSSLKSFNNCTIEQIFAENPGKSLEEAQAMATKMLEHELKKHLQKGHQIIAETYQNKKLQVNPTPPTTKDHNETTNKQNVVSPDQKKHKKHRNRRHRSRKSSATGGQKKSIGISK